MTPRPRKRGNKDLPPNLYKYATCYVYKNPRTGKRHGMGTNRREAIKAANILNHRISSSPNLIARVMGGQTVAEVIKRYRAEHLPEKELSPRSMSETVYRLNRYERELGQTDWQAFDLAALSSWLKPLTRESYRKHRAQWIDLYRFACSVGLAEKNIAELTLGKKPAERVRKRWTIEQFKAARLAAEPWLRIAMDLAVITLQRREDLCAMRYDDIQGGRLLVTQHKTEARIAIQVGPELGRVINEAKSAGLLCPTIIARKPVRGRRTPGKHPFSVNPGFLTKAVAAARDKTGLFDSYGEGERPTLHELRSLGAHLYREAGTQEDKIQALLGHATAKMTAHYLDGHKIEFAEVSADLPRL